MNLISTLAADLSSEVHESIPRVLPVGWEVIQRFGDGNAYQHSRGLRVIVSTAPFEEDNGREWMHISVSRKERCPSYDDMKFVKMAFAESRFGYMVFPPPSENVNIHEFCLHIWVPLTGELPMPNFGAGGTI